MGKIGMKLLPLIWFHKSKVASKKEETTTQSKSCSQPGKFTAAEVSKSPYKSSINRKGVDILFASADSPERTLLSELTFQKKEGIPDLGWPLQTVDVSTVKPPTSFAPIPDMEAQKGGHFVGSLDNNPPQGNNVACFDMRELECRLRALGSEERRKYYSSPMFSVALPTPRQEGVLSDETLDVASYSSATQPFNVGHALGMQCVEGAHSRSPNQSVSCRQSSSSSSDTAMDRASSSMWERDLLSFTSEGSEVVTSVADEPIYPMPRPFYQNKKPKEKINLTTNSPSIYDDPPALRSNQDSGHSYSGYNREASVLPSRPLASHVRPLDHQELLAHEEEHRLVLAHYESDNQERQKRTLCKKFSYSDSKRRLLQSARASFERPAERAISESEVETMSNYKKFKLQQRRNADKMYGHTLQRSSSHHSYRDPKKDSMCRASRTNGLHSAAEVGKFNRGGFTMGNQFAHEQNLVDDTSIYDRQVRFQGTVNAMKERARETSIEACNSKVFDSFAMMKCSRDPRQDFKVSMVEMIIEKGLCSPKDMVELLQCYLTLNDEIYHHVIIKVMREVWHELFQQEGI